MSEDVAYKGKLKPTGLTVDQTMADVTFPDYYDRHDSDDVGEFFSDHFYNIKVVIGGLVFDVEKEDLPDSEIFTSTKNDDGSYDFVVKYYNGGMSFDEAIHQATGGE